MPRSLIMTLLVISTATARGQVAGSRPLPRDEFRRWAAGHAAALGTGGPRGDRPDLAPLAEIIAGARVVALGESMHGAREELALRNRIIRHLAIEGGLASVALEIGLSPSKRLYDYVLGRADASDEELAGAFTHGFGAYAENRDLVRWLRDHNAAVPPERRVRLYGLDLTGSYSQEARRSLEMVFAYLDRADRRLAAAVRADYTDIIPKVDLVPYLALPEAERDRIAAELADLVERLRRERVGLVASGSLDDYDWALRQAIGALQDNALQRALPTGFTLEGRFERYRREGLAWMNVPFDQRDAAMADNVAWILGREGARGRVLLYAHNDHVQAVRNREAPQPGGPLGSIPGAFPFGSHLRALLGRDYVAIGMQHGALRGWPRGRRGPTPQPAPGSLQELMTSPGLPAYLVDLRRLPEAGPLRDWMWAEQLEGTPPERIVVPARCFDALIYIDALGPSRTEDRRGRTNPGRRGQ